MIEIFFPNGSVKEFPMGVTGLQIAQSISKSLEKSAIAAKVSGKLLDLSAPITEDAKVEIVTVQTDEGLDILRHDTAHLLAQAVKELFPQSQIAIGPTIENGFYYDILAPRPFTQEDLLVIEAKMLEIAKQNLTIERRVYSKVDAIEYFKSIGEDFKVEIINELPDSDEISLYFQGDFADLCRGPHAPSTSRLRYFKLLKVSGAYWRGDSNNQMLQRIYGTAWSSAEDLEMYLRQLEEAEKRDHRKLGQEMNLFHFQDIAPGAIFWHPKGWTIFQELVSYMRRRQRASGYLEINTPEVLSKTLWEESGHWDKFGENMFTAKAGDEDKVLAVKPMNCPGGVQVYKSELRSYKNLPLKLAEFGKVHRYEPSGALHGMMRVRAFTQDDAHVFCTPSQLQDECAVICKLMITIFNDFGFDNVRIKFSDRPQKRIGDDDVWDKAESALMQAAKNAGLEITLNPGEGAFYGPKLEFVLKDAIGRDWQIGTLQVDLNLPQRLGAYYIDQDGSKQVPVMLHQANFGSLERFFGILLEHYAGKLPLWLAPVQLVIATITNDAQDYAAKLYDEFVAMGVRCVLDTENEKINYKIRKHFMQKSPIILVIGKAEAANASVTVRKLGKDDHETLELSEFKAKLESELKKPF